MGLYKELCAISDAQQLREVARQLWNPDAQVELTQELVAHRVLVPVEDLIVKEELDFGACGDDKLSDMIADMQTWDSEEELCVHMLQLISLIDVSLSKFLDDLVSKLTQ